MSIDLEQLKALGENHLPGLLGIEFTGIEVGQITAGLDVHQELLAPNGYLDAGTVVTLADTCCGHGSLANLPSGAFGFTTIELKPTS